MSLPEWLSPAAQSILGELPEDLDTIGPETVAPLVLRALARRSELHVGDSGGDGWSIRVEDIESIATEIERWRDEI